MGFNLMGTSSLEKYLNARVNCEQDKQTMSRSSEKVNFKESYTQDLKEAFLFALMKSQLEYSLHLLGNIVFQNKCRHRSNVQKTLHVINWNTGLLPLKRRLKETWQQLSNLSKAAAKRNRINDSLCPLWVKQELIGLNWGKADLVWIFGKKKQLTSSKESLALQ